MDDLGVLGAMSGVAVHDGWKSYRHYGVDHALCNAHHLRELKAVGIGWDQGWANDLAGLLVEAKHAVEEARDSGPTTWTPPPCTRSGFATDNWWPGASWPTQRRRPASGRAMKRRPSTCCVDSTANGRRPAVRHGLQRALRQQPGRTDIRMVKLQQKISGSWRTLEGARNFCAIRSYASTLRKQEHNVLAGLRQLFEGHAWLPAGA